MLSRVVFIGSVLLLALAWWMVRRARKRKRPVGRMPWILSIFAVACLLFLIGHIVTGGEPLLVGF